MSIYKLKKSHEKQTEGKRFFKLNMLFGAVSIAVSSGAFAGFCTDAPVSGEQYKIVNEGSGIDIEVVSKSKDDQAKLIQRPGRSKLDSQKFTLTEVKDGQWTISAVHSDKLLTSSNDLVQNSKTGSDNQYWKISPAGLHAFTIKSVSSNQLMTAESGEFSAFVSADKDQDSSYQKWFFSPQSRDCASTVIRLDGGADNGKVALYWEKIKGDVEGLEVFYDTDSNPTGRTRLAMLDTSSRSYTASGLENNTDYWFWVKYKADGVWHNSNGFKATPKSKGAMLSQISNPIKSELEVYKDTLLTGTLAEDKVIADNIISWQLPNGGFYKNKEKVYQKPWDGESKRSGWISKVENDDGTVTEVELGTIDNDATVRELMFLADVYQRSGDAKYKDAAVKAFDFLINMQYSKGGWPQVYPKRTGTLYSNYVTFNDDAMIRVMYMMEGIMAKNWPFNADLFTNKERSAAERANKKGMKYIRKAQIQVNGKRTIWSAQHDPDDYSPLGARSYELPGKNGKASALIIAYLMSIPQTEDIKEVVEAGLTFYRDPAVQKADAKYIKRSKSSTDDTYNPIQNVAGKTMWYRFYELDSNTPFFSGRLSTDNPPGVGKQYNIMDVEPERRYGYEWGGSYGEKLIKFANNIGY